ncbi:MAG: hypothetical protein GX876_12420 [Bacteroidales bacterium]|nr:hypothetical protein [Bacteroidales bacterium]
MKKIITLSTIVFLIANVFAQPPQIFSYQAVVRNSAGELVSGKPVGIQFSILQGSESGTAVYVERHTVTTNANGLATTNVGNGAVVSGNFSEIDWSAANYFIKTEIDPAGGDTYTITGTSLLMSVPYALYSKTSKNAEKLILPYSASIAHSDYAFKITNSASSALYAETRSPDVGTIAIRGSAITGGASGTTSGVSGSSDSKAGRGVSGSANSPTGSTTGVYGVSSSSEGVGTWGYAQSETGYTTGVYGASNSPSGKGIYGICYPATGTGYGVCGTVNSPDAYSGFFKGGRFHVDGNVGIGTTTPNAKLDVDGQVRIRGGNPGTGKVLTSDAGGRASWEPVPAPTVNHICFEVKLTTSYELPLMKTARKIDFSSGAMVWENRGNAFNTTTSTFTVPEAGIYSFRGAIHFEDITSGQLIYAVLKAGGKNYYGSRKNSNGSSEMVDIDLTIYLDQDETVELYGFTGGSIPPGTVSGNTQDENAFTFFSGARVR